MNTDFKPPCQGCSTPLKPNEHVYCNECSTTGHITDLAKELAEKDATIERLEAEVKRLREALESVRDFFKYEANSAGGVVARLDKALS
jgi:molybdopterin/thiamine biosynthesis adenylyltransferase